MYNVFKIQPCKSVHGPESAIIIFRIKPCYTFGHTKRLRLFTRPRARETCTHLSRIISDAWEKNSHETFSSGKTSTSLSYFTSAYYSTQITRRDIKTKTSHFYNNQEATRIFLIRGTYVILHFSPLLSFFPLLSILPFTRTQRISSSTQTLPSRCRACFVITL